MKIMKDSHQISKVMKVVLPEQYQQVEYVESSGDAYINTQFAPDGNTSAEVKARRTDSASTGAGFFGARQESGYRGYTFIQQSDGKYAFAYANNLNATSASWDRNDHVYYRNKNVMYLDGAEKVRDTLSSFTCSYNCLLFTYNNGGSHSTSSRAYRIYYCKIWDNGTLVRDMVPCYEKEAPTNIGFYDLVNGVFYDKKGSGTFSKGSDCAHEISKIYKGTNVIWQK